MNTSITSTQATDGQKKQVKRLAEDAIDRVFSEGVLDKDGTQKLVEEGDEFQADILASIRKHSVSNQFADEEVESSYGYLSGYKPKGITQQCNRLRELIPGVGFADEKLAEQPLPAGAEGWFAIPKWQTIAPTYGEALQKVLDQIKKTRNGKFYNYREGQLGADRLRQHQKNAKAFAKLCEQQKDHDILVVACQFGKLHAGRSVRRAREVMPISQFGLDPFAVACMMLTHPERLQHYDDLWIDCAGADYDCDADGRWGSTPCFGFSGGEVGFAAYYVCYARGNYGSSSAFLPQ